MPSNKNQRTGNESDSSGINRIMISSVIGSVMFFALISLFSVLALKSDVLSRDLYMPLGLFCGAVSSFVCGFIAVRPVRINGFATGAISGFSQAVICSAAVFFINGNNAGAGIFILMAVMIAVSSIGGISAVNLKVKKKY